MNRHAATHAVAILSFASALGAQDAGKIVREAQDRARSESQRYLGTLEVMDTRNKITTKRWTYHRIGSAGNSKVVLRFTAPAEVKGVALLVVNHPDRASDQWMWTPNIARDRRIALQDRSTRFFGTDFSFEDLEERDAGQYDFKLLGEETRDGVQSWKIESRPRQTKTSQYTHSYLWVDQSRYVFLEIESYNKDRMVRRLKYKNYQKVQGIWTPLAMEIADVARKSRTILKTEKLEYNVPMKEQDFTLQALRRES